MSQYPPGFEPTKKSYPEGFEPIKSDKSEEPISGNEPGNIDLKKQPKVDNPDGGKSTVYSRSYNIDGKEVLLPSVTPDGRFLKTDDEVINEYKKTGKHLGKFNTTKEANKYAEQLHKDYESGKYDEPVKPIYPAGFEPIKPAINHTPNEPVKPETPVEDKSLLTKAFTPLVGDNFFFKQLTDPNHQILKPTGEGGMHDFAAKTIAEISGLAGGITDAAVPTSPAGIASLFALPAGAKMGTKLFSKIAPEAAEAIGNFLTKGRSLFGKTPEAIPEVSPKVVTPEAISDTIPQVNQPKPKVKLNLDGTYSPIDNPTLKMDQTGTPLPGPIDKLLSAVSESKPLTEEQAKIYSRERASRVGEMNKISTGGQAGFWERKGRLFGEHTKVQMEPLKLEQNDVDSLFDDIHVAGLEPYQKINASTGLERILNGEVPRQHEIALLQKVFGEDKISTLNQMLPKVDKRGTWLDESLNLSKAIQASYDLSFPFRQGKGLIYSRDWWNSWGSMMRSLGSEKAYRGVIESILERPNYKTITLADGTRQEPFFQQAGLKLTDLTDLSSREEEITSTLAEKIPGIRPSNRAYTAFANKLRADHFDRLINNAEAAGLKPRENLDLAHNIAGFVNNATGRGDLGAAEKYATSLNDLLFSPRFIKSRLEMMNPANYVKLATPEGRFTAKQYTKSIMALAGAWLAEAQLAKINGAKVSEDANSTDFGKIQFGNTRLDPAAGFQQYLVLAHRLSSGQYSTTTGNERTYGVKFGSKTKFDALTDFIVNKLAPVPGYAVRAARANENQPFAFGDETMKLFTPMLIQDLSDILQEDPNLLPLMVPAAVGYGVQTQGERGKSNRLLPESVFPRESDISIPFAVSHSRRR